jgi:hypothetical protein
MIDQAVHQADVEDLGNVLREELARGDAGARAALPVLRHLLMAEGSDVFSDEILARVQGMLADLAHGLLAFLPERCGEEHGASETDVLTRLLLDQPALLSHLHALALEWRLTERLQLRLALDPVVSPLLRDIVSSGDDTMQGLSARFLAEQTRWCQSQRRMTLSLPELPRELFETALAVLHGYVGDGPGIAGHAAKAEHELRGRYDKGVGRVDLASRLLVSLDDRAGEVLSVARGGAALFLTALAAATGQARDAVVFSACETRGSRLALTLRAAGLDTAATERELLALNPESELPPGFDRISADHAAAILSSSHRRPH